MMTEDEAWDELERKQAKKWDTSDMAHRPNGLTVDANIINKAKWYQEGYDAAQHDKRNIKDDDDIQEYKRPWVNLTNDEAAECWSTSAIMTWKRIQDKLREKNNG